MRERTASEPTLALSAKSGSMAAIISLLPFLWPKNQFEMRARIVIALACLVLAKVATVYVPVFYKQAVDTLSGHNDLAMVLPLGAILAYGCARILSLAFTELRNAVFAKVGIRAVRSAALAVFRHLHQLALRFHLERQNRGLVPDHRTRHKCHRESATPGFI